MVLQFEKKSHSCLRNVLAEVQNMEQTQEIRIPEGMPGIDRVVSAWGQVVMRSKDWHGSSIHLSAGMMVWILYIGEDGSTQCTEGWIPFQIHWDLPEHCPDGTVRILCLPRYVDARTVSAGKIMIRAGVAALAEAWCSAEKTVYFPQEIPDDVELLQSFYPMRLPVEAGERNFLLEEELTLPGSVPLPHKIVCFRMEPSITDKKVLSNKVVFRGSGNLHVVYESEDGQLHAWDFELPFSQFADLQKGYSQEAQVDIRLMPTSVELENEESGLFHLKSSMAAQYLIDDLEMVELTEDAYSPVRDLSAQQQMLELPAVLDSRRENIYGEQTLPGQADLITDVQLLPDFPAQRMSEGEYHLVFPGFLQTLYYAADGSLQSSSARWEGRVSIPAEEGVHLSALPVPGIEVQPVPGADTISVRTNVPVQMQFDAGKGLPMVTGLELGEVQSKNPAAPSLIIHRADGGRLWDIAKRSGAKVESIRNANALTGEPVPGQLLLIPVK